MRHEEEHPESNHVVRHCTCIEQWCNDGRSTRGQGHAEADRRIEVGAAEVRHSDARGRRPLPEHLLRSQGRQLGAGCLHGEVHERLDEPGERDQARRIQSVERFLRRDVRAREQGYPGKGHEGV